MTKAPFDYSTPKDRRKLCQDDTISIDEHDDKECMNSTDRHTEDSFGYFCVIFYVI